MKCTRILFAIAIATGLVFAGTNAFAQGFSVTITVDEYGNGT